jgi:hypothetical protein
MFGHPARDLVRYCDGELTPERARAVEAHVVRCDRCRRACDEIRFATDLLRRVPAIQAPDDVWDAVAARLATPADVAGTRFVPHWQLQLAAVLLVVIGIAAAWGLVHRSPRPWQVAEGGRVSHRAIGDWVETSASSRAHITVANIGTVDVEPRSRVRLGNLQPTEYRLALDRGTISARVTAPPRLFIVDTPASTVVDLGCAYRATVDGDGNGTIAVTDGWISLERNGLASLVPAGASAEIDAEIGPGSPTFDDAPAGLKRMLRSLEFEDGGNIALRSVLAQARARDTLTLWHLLRRVDPNARPAVYDRIAELVPPPASVTRAQILALDAGALQRLRDELAWKW